MWGQVGSKGVLTIISVAGGYGRAFVVDCVRRARTLW